MICQKCKTDNLHGSSFCEKCGVSMTEPPVDDNNDYVIELEQRVNDMKSHLSESFKLNSQEFKENLKQLKDNLKLGSGDLSTRLSEIKNCLKFEYFENFLKEKEETLKNMFLGFIAWALLRFSTPFHPRIIGFLIGPLGLVLILLITYFYGTYENEIKQRMEKGVSEYDSIDKERDKSCHRKQADMQSLAPGSSIENADEQPGP